MDSLLETLSNLLGNENNLSLIMGIVVGFFVPFLLGKTKPLIINIWRRFFYNRKSTRVYEERFDKDESTFRFSENEREIPSKSALYIQELELLNIRCFSRIKIDFSHNKFISNTISILGDNSSGKSTILKAVALSLCNESESIALIKSLEGSLISNGEKFGVIRAKLVDSKTNEIYRIEKEITKTEDGDERIRQSSTLPKSKVFICGYGTQRSRIAQQSHEKYSPGKAVVGLFDESSYLQNPELVLLRTNEELRQIIERKLLDILLLDYPSGNIVNTKKGLNFKGPWGNVPFSSLSDGYRSTTQWILDLMAWSIFCDRIPDHKSPHGIILIDEIEQHLHPKWQRYIIQRINRQFPNMQLIVTTHTPLVLSGASDLNSNKIIRLTRDNNEIVSESLDASLLKGKRADQILTSVFELTTSRSPKSSTDVQRYSELSSKEKRSYEEQIEFEALEEKISSITSFGETQVEEDVENAVSETLKSIISNPPKEIDLEVKRQLRELFKKNDSK